MSVGRPRHDLLIRLGMDAPRPLVDVGADHGKVARALGGVATERRAHRAHGTGHWVIADGLVGFGPLGTAVIAGMGAGTISRILAAGPPLQRAILHAQDDPPRLRRWLATAGWRIIDEALAPEAGRFAEVVVAEPGVEPAEGFRLDYGPVLIDGDDPHRQAHFAEVAGWLEGLVQQTAGSPVAEEFEARLEFVRSIL